MRKPFLDLSFEGTPNIPCPWQMQGSGWAMIIGSLGIPPHVKRRAKKELK
jgi:hypothetical protein